MFLVNSKIICSIILVLIFVIIFNSKKNNTCYSYEGYMFIFFSSDCFYSPDVDDDVFGIIRRHIGFSELHEVQTEDGYILGIVRIPRQNPKGVVYMQHPVATDSKIWVSQFNESLAFMLWNEGFDVWLGNNRGTPYSQKHVKLKTTERAFWNYSMDEIGYFDLHATIPYISKKTDGKKIVYYGLSLGASTGLIYAITRAKEAVKFIQLMIVISPPAYFQAGSSLFRLIIPTLFYFQNFSTYDNIPIGGYDAWHLKISKFFLRICPFKQVQFYFLEGPFFGWTDYETDPKLIPLLIETFGASVSLNVYKHFYQLFKYGGSFQMFDYGEGKNLEKYGTKTPPLYNPGNIKLPVLVVSGGEDSLVHHMDNQILYCRLSDEAKYEHMFVEGLNHLNFVSGRHRIERFYNKILELLNKVS